MIKVKIDKYEVIEDLANGTFKALRHGQEWRDLIGDNLILALVSRLAEAEDLFRAAQEDYEGEVYWSIERFLEEGK